MPKCACQTLVCNAHQVVSDTIHNVIVNDTVRTFMDSSVTLQAIKDSQQFYSDKFGDLMMAFTIFIAIIAVIVGYKFYNDDAVLKRTIKDTAQETAAETENKFNAVIEKQSKEMERLNDFVEETKQNFQKTIDEMQVQFKKSFDEQNEKTTQLMKFVQETKENFKKNAEEQDKETARLAMLVKENHEQEILNWITQARLAKMQKQNFHSFMCNDYALSAVVKHYDKTFVQYGRIALEELRDNIASISVSSNKEKIIQSILEKIESFKNCLLNTNYDSDKSMADKEKVYVNDSLGLITSIKLLFEQELKNAM